MVFHHSNLRLPIGFERLLSKIIVTPRMHGIHHSQVRRENNSNFGTVFTWWDRLHRTLGLNIPQDEVTDLGGTHTWHEEADGESVGITG